MGLRVAVMGATGAVGREMLLTLEQRSFPTSSVKALASKRSAGKKLPFRGGEVVVEELTHDSFGDVEVVLASAGGSVSKEFAPSAVKAGAVVVDNTSAFRMDKDVPLVVPEVNPHDLDWHKGLISNPNCSTIQMVVALAPIHRAFGIQRIVVSTYQAVSGKGALAVQELKDQVEALRLGQPVQCNSFPYQIAYNCLPHIDAFEDNGYTKEEMKMVNETRKILGDQTIMVSATTVRVPVFRGHSESVNFQTRKPATVADIRALLEKAPGVKVMDDPKKSVYPTALDCDGRDETFVGRLRADPSAENAFNCWVVSDNLRKGAALNAVQIAEELMRRNLIPKAKK
ncbi:MAG: aspartate-semialdehyde dehydrogenase [Candidatus Sumerlaeota bacterium]|nr:aspartate-semialdehyde dehydrogenase [Candidatus Sumerlaeota bacterium]